MCKLKQRKRKVAKKSRIHDGSKRECPRSCILHLCKRNADKQRNPENGVVIDQDKVSLKEH